MLFHTAAFGTNGNPFGFEVGARLDRRIRQFDEKHWAGVGWCHHAQRDFAFKRRGRVLRAADPVRRHETELELAAVELLGVVNARVARFNETLLGLRASAVEKLGECQPLGIKSSAVLRSTHFNRHKILPPAENPRFLPFTLPSSKSANRFARKKPHPWMLQRS